jgi:hypothetical protein
MLNIVFSLPVVIRDACPPLAGLSAGVIFFAKIKAYPNQSIFKKLIQYLKSAHS